MSRAPCTFRQRDVTAAIKAVTAAGIGVARVEIDKTGKIVILTGNPVEQTMDTSSVVANNPWDSLL